MTRDAGYELFDGLIARLRAEGHDAAAAQLHSLLHAIAWTTSSELLGELGLEILRFERAAAAMSPELRQQCESCMAIVRRQWPDIR